MMRVCVLNVCFNPTMVRLQASSSTGATTVGMSVSIPLWCDCKFLEKQSKLAHFWFQSHYGAIARFHDTSPPCDFLWFQSHYGAIARSCPRLHEPSSLRFNPTMVRLQGLQGMQVIQGMLYVSIPLWCDCKVTFKCSC